VLVEEEHAVLVGWAAYWIQSISKAIPLIILTMRGARRISLTPYSLVFTNHRPNTD
jgi:hypothetical protein